MSVPCGRKLVFFLIASISLFVDTVTGHRHDENQAITDNEKEVKIGVLLPMTGYWPIGKTSASAITIAVDRINEDQTLLPGYNMTFLWNDSMCLAAEGLNQAVEFRIAGVDAIIRRRHFKSICLHTCTWRCWTNDSNYVTCKYYF